MKLVVGLGNPGAKYKKTRHNAGRRLVEELALRHKLQFVKSKNLSASTALCDLGEEEILLAYPEVFMNCSGEAVGGLVRHYSIDPQKNLLILVDDVALPFGRLRLRSRGSDGGHNGLKSINLALDGSGYARLRLGIARTGEDGKALVQGEGALEKLEKYVLSSFSAQEEELLPLMMARGYEAVRLWVAQPID
ncbi:MAG: aminoacyl-tRNA hydrolase [Candidatus Omnitrophica bacterium]|nr:aminoacyl-tRNA hydrolase [Candidatus Omnitrophota bacterium]MDD5671109.1 aminoacyl-tRNA hydrolase [Candidatus Omnitrophota bacterium]